MAGNTEATKTDLLKDQFDFGKHGFYDVTPFVDANVGFSFKKKFKDELENVSLFHLLIPNKIYNDQSIIRKPILISVVYGKDQDNGVLMRDFYKTKLSSPIDLEFRDQFFYDSIREEFYKNDIKVSADKILSEIYAKHVKPTKLIGGLFLRFKLRLWKIWLPYLLDRMGKPFYYLLILISGDRYTYTFLFQEENLNGKIISSKFDGRVGLNKQNQLPEARENDEGAKKIQFFGIDVPQWPIVFYSALHLLFWFLLKYTCFVDENTKNTIRIFFDNNFLTVIYVIVSFWLVDTITPLFLKKLIKTFSVLSALSLYKKIRA